MDLQRLPGDLDKNIDEILAEVDKDKNGEVDYDEVIGFAVFWRRLSCRESFAMKHRSRVIMAAMQQ